MALRQKLLAYMSNPNYAGKSLDFLLKQMGVSESELKAVSLELINEGIIFVSRKGDYFLCSRFNLVKGEIKKMFSRFAIAQYYLQDEIKEVKIAANDLKDAFCYDSVLLSLIDEENAAVYKVLKRGNDIVVGEFHRGTRSYLTPDDDSLPFRVMIKPIDSKNAVDGHKVLVRITSYDKEITGKVIKILGHKNDPGVDIMSLVYRHKVPYEFSDDVLKEAMGKPTNIEAKEIVGRMDFREHLICTIDGQDAKDLDDAVEVRVLSNGNYELGVHIADVSHYVSKGSLIDIAAFERGTSVYMVDSVIPMLPHVLSNGICSLNPNEERLTMSCIMEIDQRGQVVKYKIGPSIIRSSYRLNYDDVNAFYAGNFNYDPALAVMLNDMYALSKILTEMKKARGALNLDAPEAKIILNEKGKIKEITLRTSGIGERVIEDFMVATNETTAKHISDQHLPYIYRVHDKPKLERFISFQTQLLTLGYRVKLDKGEVNPHDLQNLLDRVKDKPESTIISSMMLRSFAKAIYDSVNIGHFGLASKCYAHFTSPIRRYPDLQAHRLQKLYATTTHLDQEQILIETTQIAMQSSLYERRAVELERAVDDMKKAEYMGDHIGEIFSGIISGVITGGFFVELPNTIEGMVRFESMDDYYEYDPKTMSAIGQATHKHFTLGNKVMVKCKSVNKNEGQIEFTFIQKLK